MSDGWHLAPSLEALRDEVNEVWPHRPKTSDGTVGDLAHRARTSEHNPDDDPDPMPIGAVSAMDITKMSAAGMERIRKALIGDPRVWYVIHDGTIWSRTNGFKGRKYTGSNPHRVHLHVSLMQTRKAHDDTGSWGIRAPRQDPEQPPKPQPPKADKDSLSGPRTIQRGDRGELVRVLQAFLGVDPASGHFGPLTKAQVRRYQRDHHLVDDGIVGPKTWTAMREALDVPKAIW